MRSDFEIGVTSETRRLQSVGQRFCEFGVIESPAIPLEECFQCFAGDGKSLAYLDLWDMSHPRADSCGCQGEAPGPAYSSGFSEF